MISYNPHTYTSSAMYQIHLALLSCVPPVYQQVVYHSSRICRQRQRCVCSFHGLFKCQLDKERDVICILSNINIIAFVIKWRANTAMAALFSLIC